MFRKLSRAQVASHFEALLAKLRWDGLRQACLPVVRLAVKCEQQAAIGRGWLLEMWLHTRISRLVPHSVKQLWALCPEALGPEASDIGLLMADFDCSMIVQRRLAVDCRCRRALLRTTGSVHVDGVSAKAALPRLICALFLQGSPTP